MREVGNSQTIIIELNLRALEDIINECYGYIEETMYERIIAQREADEKRSRNKFLH